jgi:hypothetical protein
VRGTLARRFPALGLERRRKVGAATFYRSLLAAEGPAVAARDYPALASLGVIDERSAKAGIRQIFADNRELYRAWELVNLETWVAQFVQ